MTEGHLRLSPSPLARPWSGGNCSLVTAQTKRKGVGVFLWARGEHTRAKTSANHNTELGMEK